MSNIIWENYYGFFSLFLIKLRSGLVQEIKR